jgi:diadenosine tetraphosphate (Ap4A) HIT family hydrolase
MHTKYLTYPRDKNFMANAPSIKDYQYWRIIENKFPYDTIAETHHLLVPKRQVPTYYQLNESEQAELNYLLYVTLNDEYDGRWYNSPKAQSVKDWLHFHLIVVK